MKKIIASFIFCTLVCSANSQDIKKWKITDVEKLMQVKENNDAVLVINFWATFCKPCVAEIPSFIKITDRYKGMDKPVQLYLVSLDLPTAYPAKIAAFAKEKAFNANLVWLEETNADYFCPKIDTSWSGSIPATLIINTKTGARRFIEGEVSAKNFELALMEVVNPPKPGPATPVIQQ